MNTQTLQLKLAAVPDPIKIWLGSDVVINAVEDLYKKFNLDPESRVIPKLLLRLEIQDLAARHFWAELASQLKLSKESAQPVIEEIRGRILNPIQKDLGAIGVKLDELNIFEAAPPEQVPKAIPAPAKIPTEIPTATRLPDAASIENAPPPINLPFAIAGDAPVAAPKPLGALPSEAPAGHVRGAPAAIPPPSSMPGATSFDNNSGIKPVEQKRGFRFGIPGLRFGEANPTEPVARNARLEIGQKVSPLAKDLPGKVGGDAPRIVHYSQWKTPSPAAGAQGSSGQAPAGPLPFSQLGSLGSTPRAGSPAPAPRPSISPISGPLTTPSPAPAAAPQPALLKKDVPPPTPAVPEPKAPVSMDNKEGFFSRVTSSATAPALAPPPGVAAPTPAGVPAPPPKAPAMPSGIPAPALNSPPAKAAIPAGAVAPAMPPPAPKNTEAQSSGASPAKPEVLDLRSLR